LAGTCRSGRIFDDFVDIKVPEAAWPTIVRNCTFAEMKAQGERYAPPGAENIWKGGSQTFFNKGTNNRWREVLGAEEVALYDAAAHRVLTPDCRRWLEHGGQPE
jgi:aryl sulfotransferase